MYMLVRSRMCLIMGQIEPEHLELFTLEFGKIAESDSVYTLASMYKYLPLNLEKLLNLTLFIV